MHARTRTLIILAQVVLAGRSLFRIMKLEHRVDLLQARLRVGYNGYNGPPKVYVRHRGGETREEILQQGRELYDKITAPKPTSLVVTQGADVGARYRLDALPVVIGSREDATLRLTDDFVSGHHARIFPGPETWYVEDLGSVNGTYLDRAKIGIPTPLPVYTPVRIGKTVLELQS